MLTVLWYATLIAIFALICWAWNVLWLWIYERWLDPIIQRWYEYGMKIYLEHQRKKNSSG